MITADNLFVKKHDFLICVDSDGCAMDTMTYKHKQAFCPKLIEVYKLYDHGQIISDYWLHINLYSATRGINRFKGLAMTLKMLLDKGIDTPGASQLINFVNTTHTLSNTALTDAISNGGGEGLRLALAWSNAVNDSVKQLSSIAKPFNGCGNVLEELHKKAHIAVVSSANGAAVEQEWNEFGLAQHTDIRFGQEAGSKAACIKKLLLQGFKQNNVLMVGDALGDLDAAKENNVLFYPILVENEETSWQTLLATVAPAFFANSYAGKMENEFIMQQAQILK